VRLRVRMIIWHEDVGGFRYACIRGRDMGTM